MVPLKDSFRNQITPPDVASNLNRPAVHFGQVGDIEPGADIKKDSSDQVQDWDEKYGFYQAQDVGQGDYNWRPNGAPEYVLDDDVQAYGQRSQTEVDHILSHGHDCS